MGGNWGLAEAGEEIGFDGNAFRLDVEQAVAKHLPCGVGETDKKVDMLPGAEEVVQTGAGKKPAGVESRVPVDLAADGFQRDDAGHAVEKEFVLYKEETRGAEDAKIMDGVHDGYAHPAGRDEDGDRKASCRERVSSPV